MPNAHIGFMPGIINIKCLKVLTNGWGFHDRAPWHGPGTCRDRGCCFQDAGGWPEWKGVQASGDHLWLCVRDSDAWNVLPSGRSQEDWECLWLVVSPNRAALATSSPKGNWDTATWTVGESVWYIQNWITQPSSIITLAEPHSPGRKAQSLKVGSGRYWGHRWQRGRG